MITKRIQASVIITVIAVLCLLFVFTLTNKKEESESTSDDISIEPTDTPEEHNYVNGICTICGAADPNYTMSSTEIANNLFNSVLFSDDGYESYSNYETVSVFSNNVTDAFSLSTVATLQCSVMFDITNLASQVSILNYTIGSETGAKEGLTVEVYGNGDKQTGILLDKYTVSASSVPTLHSLNLSEIQTLYFYVEGNNGTVVIYNLSSNNV